MDMTGPLSAATESFIAGADWLTPEDGPAVASLRLMAAALDQQLVPGILSSYGLTYRSLLKRKPTADAPADPLEALLGGAGA